MRRRAVFSKLALFSCAFHVVYLICLPFMSYILEPLPFTQVERSPPAFPATPIQLDYNASKQYAADLQQIYDRSAIPVGNMYYRDSANFVDVMRTLVKVSSTCPDRLQLLHDILGTPYFPPDLKDSVVACICSRGSCDAVARSWQFQLMTTPSSIVAAWIVDGDDILGHIHDVKTVYVVFVPAKQGTTWRWMKFIFRSLVALAILRRLVLDYLVQIWRLHTSLLCLNANSPSTVAEYEIDLGDPSLLIFYQPWLCTAFVVDIWISCEYIGLACIRLCQTYDMPAFCISILYLGRLVWFSYATLVAVNKAREHPWRPRAAQSWLPTNSNHLSIMAYLVAGVLTFLQSLWPRLVEIYTWLFAVCGTYDDAGQIVVMDIIVVMLIFVLPICMFPLILAVANGARLLPRADQPPSSSHESNNSTSTTACVSSSSSTVAPEPVRDVA
ncbi:hypothetical protein AeNC1_000900 [Aphanomyces euteiches]|nr:hypothetical protein AeNC1_000900 [Aphanomyces euteiches]